MKRLTTDDPQDNTEAALNLFYIKDGWTWVRGGGPEPDYPDVRLCDFMRMIVKKHIPDAEIPDDDDYLCDMLYTWLTDGPEDICGLVALLNTTAWAFSLLRKRLADYEDTELEPNEIKSLNAEWHASLDCLEEYRSIGSVSHLRELAQAEKDGRLVVLPRLTD